jgi:hypothetical protein
MFCVTNKVFVLAMGYDKQSTNEVAWIAGKTNAVVCSKTISS